MLDDPAAIAAAFFQSLPEIHRQLVIDATAIERGDPAAESVDEVILAYPGFLAIAVHRIAHRLSDLGVPLLPRVLSEWAHERTGIDIHPGATLGHPVVIDHGTGIVIGETAVIGNNVKLYQGVTLGALSVAKSLASHEAPSHDRERRRHLRERDDPRRRHRHRRGQPDRRQHLDHLQRALQFHRLPAQRGPRPAGPGGLRSARLRHLAASSPAGTGPGDRPARPTPEEIPVAKANNVLELIGNTPELRINKLFDPRVEVWAKLERQNPGGSIKDRIALSMVEDAEKRGVLRPGSVIVEPTSGNTGVGLALVAAVKGYKLILVMPESFSVERRKLMAAYGATFELTPRELGMKGAIAKARELVASTPNAWLPMQFDNPANLEVHKRTTAEEVARDFPEGLDYVFAGVGTGGHVTAIGEVLRPRWPKLQVFAVEPELSPVLSGGTPGPHPIQGIGAGFVPGNYHAGAVTGVIQVSAPDAFTYAVRAAREEGLFVGVSSGAVFAAVAKKLPEIKDGARILAFTYDTGERYLSVPGLFDLEPEAVAVG